MSDTRRTQADLQAFFADNTTGNITPQMLRDFLESCVPAHGALHFTDPGTPTTIAAQNTYVKAANATVADMLHDFTMSGNNQLQYAGTTIVHGRVIATMTISAASNNQVLDFAIYRNGVILTPSIQKTKISTSGDQQAITLHCMTDINPGDYFEVWVANETSASNLTVQHGYLSISTWLH